ncbi:hypothetical protein PJL18_03507 [Paenarthrobacter nicotinovorans]|nr:hypothetical protein [Paenarthrobacter nicotinovorans]
MAKKPFRRQPNGASNRARRGVVTNPSVPAGTRPDGASPSKPASKTAAGSSTPGSGNTKDIIRRTSGFNPTGSSMVRAAPSEFPAAP